MTSLTEVYDENARGGPGLRRLYAGTGLVLGGVALAVLAVLLPTTGLFGGVGGGEYGAVKWAGVLAGLAVPVALVGVFVVLPAGRRVHAAVAISATLCLLGVALFWHAYPAHWRGYGDQLTLEVSAVYLIGLVAAIWCLFTAVANFKTRNDPGGALEMNVTRRGETRIVEVEGSKASGFGAVGLFGGQPDGEVDTQTNRTAGSGEASPDATAAAPASDGGATTADITSPLDRSGGADDRSMIDAGDGRDAEIVDESSPAEPADRYCGNCEHFSYVRSSSGITPYCGRFDEAMDDMDACEEWTPNRS